MKKVYKLHIIVCLFILGISVSSCSDAIATRDKIDSLHPPEHLVLATQTLNPITVGKQQLMEFAKIIEQYYSDHGQYPVTISDLMPEYIKKIPYTYDGHRIWYIQDNEFGYMIGFEPTEKKYCSYVKSEDLLECGFNNPETLMTPVLLTEIP